ncbi:MAG: o-succinylbenzoate synthase [Rhizonema sp. PD37]|nr:o-succinylbenzoate synthase [Rhizonema sp. PD37]
MKYRFEFRPYRRKFKQPLATSHGLWEVREGIILRLSDKTGCTGFGEIAPVKWFGSESFEEALEFCRQLPLEISTDDVFAVPSELPACQFGFESAWEEVRSCAVEDLSFNLTQRGVYDEDLYGFQSDKSITFSGLLPTGKAALDEWRNLWEQGYRTFKWKIGVASIVNELEVFEKLAFVLPSKVKLRLDANGGLSFVEAAEWLKACDRHQINIEFLEQPLPTSEFNAMLSLSNQYSTKLALDESVANIHQLKTCYQQGWRGIFVIKPAIAGSPKLLRQFFQDNEIDAVFSTVFETPIGKCAGLRLNTQLSKNNRAAGYGIAHWFTNNDFFSELETTSFQPHTPAQPTAEEIWIHL